MDETDHNIDLTHLETVMGAILLAALLLVGALVVAAWREARDSRRK